MREGFRTVAPQQRLIASIANCETARQDNCTVLTRNLSGDEIANVNFLYHDIVHAVHNTIDSCTNSAKDRRGYVSEGRFTKFSEITQYNGLCAVQGHSSSPMLVPIESSYRLPISD